MAMFCRTKQFQSRLIVKGPSAVGKTCLVLRLLFGLYDKVHKPTTKEENYVRRFHPSAGVVNLLVNDTLGTDSSRWFTPMEDGDVVMFVYAIDDRQSFMSVVRMAQDMKESINIGDDLPILIVGAKSDLAEERQVFGEDVTEKMKDLKVWHMEVSTKANQNMSELLSLVLRAATKQKKFSKVVKTKAKRMVRYDKERE
ncbi:uncharacterized protein LOC144439195 [Glandiceps talaboti]